MARLSVESTLCYVNGVDDGARTHDRRNHNPMLYQLSYAHHCYPADQSYQMYSQYTLARPAGIEPATLSLEG